MAKKIAFLGRVVLLAASCGVSACSLVDHAQRSFETITVPRSANALVERSRPQVTNTILAKQLPLSVPPAADLTSRAVLTHSGASLRTQFHEPHTSNPLHLTDDIDPFKPAWSELLKPGNAAADYPLSNQPRIRGHQVTLSHLIDSVLENNVEIQIAREALSASEQAVINRFLAYLPQVTASADFQRLFQNIYDSSNEVFVDGSTSFNVATASISANQPILDLNRLFAIEASQIGKSSKEATYLAEVQRVVFETVDAYFSVLAAKAGVSGAKRRAGVVTQQIQAETAAIEEGVDTDMQRLVFNLERSNALLAVNGFEQALEDGLGKLSELSGVPVDDVPSVAIPSKALALIPDTQVERLHARALDGNYLIRQKKLEVLQSHAELKGDFAEDYSPTITGFGSYDYEDRGGSRFGGSSRTGDVTVGVRLSVPLFNSSGNGYLSRESAYEYRATVLEEARVRRKVESEIRRIVRRMRRIKSGISQAGASAGAANALIARQSAAIEVGTDIAASRLPYQVELVRATAEASRLQFELARSWMRLMYLTGADFSEMFAH